MKKLNIVLTSVLLVLGLFFLSTYSKPGQEGSPIIIGINDWTGFDPFILADKLNLFEHNNVSVKVKRFSSATEELEAIKKGEIQAAGFTLDEAFSLIGSGFKGKIVLVVDYSMGGDMLIGQKSITNVSQLVGKNIGYEGSVVGEFLLDRALRTNHLKRDQVTLTDVSADKWLSTFKSKDIDALVCYNPVANTLLDEHSGNLLFSSAEMPFEIIDVLLFSESFYDDNKAAIAKILEAWFDALHIIDFDIETAADIISAEKHISADNYKSGLNYLVHPKYSVNKDIMDPNSDKNIYKYSQVIVNFMLAEGLLSKRINTANAFDSDVLLLIAPSSVSQ